MAESTRFFAGTSEIQDTLDELTQRLDALGVPDVIIGGMALTAHGYARMTEDIDVLVTRAIRRPSTPSSKAWGTSGHSRAARTSATPRRG